MKLLIITQKVDIDDDLLGFMHGWISEFAKHCEKIIVICLYEGIHNFPSNVRVLSLCKEKGRSKIKYISKFYKYIWQERKNYDKVFVHMNLEYVLLGGIFWRLCRKKIGLWYAHGSTSPSLRIAEKLSDVIFTSTKSGFRVNSKKVNVIGQGIDVNKFSSNAAPEFKDSIFKIISIGRISPVKDYETLVGAIEILVNHGVKLEADIIGGAGLPAQKKYLENVKKIIIDKKLDNIIKFIGPIPNKEIKSHLQKSELFVNTSHTGSLDKAILEAMASGLPILTCNEALEDTLGNYKGMLMYPKKDYKKLAEKIKFIMEMDDDKRVKMGVSLREIVALNHSLEGFVKKIIYKYDFKK